MWYNHFDPVQLEDCCITKFKRAQIRGGETVLSEAYERVRSCFSHFAVVEWPEEGLFTARIKCFVKVEVVDLQQDRVLHCGMQSWTCTSSTLQQGLPARLESV